MILHSVHCVQIPMETMHELAVPELAPFCQGAIIALCVLYCFRSDGMVRRLINMRRSGDYRQAEVNVARAKQVRPC